MRSNYTDRKALEHLWQSDESLATTLIVWFLDEFGTEGLEWDPLTIAMEVSESVGVEPSQRPLNRLLAAITILTTDLFYRDLPSFIELCNVLATGDFDPGTFDPADAAEMAWSLTELMLIDPPEENASEVFAPDIIKYMQIALREEGILFPPGMLYVAGDMHEIQQKILQDWSDQPEFAKQIIDAGRERSRLLAEQVKLMMAKLIDQLERLPLTEGEVGDVLARLRQIAPSPTVTPAQLLGT